MNIYTDWYFVRNGVRKMKGGNKGLVSSGVRICFLLAILLSLFTVIYSTGNYHDDVRFFGNNDGLFLFSDGWELQDGDAVSSLSLPSNKEFEVKNETVRLVNTLPLINDRADTFLFRTSLQAVRIYVEGKEIYSYGFFEKAFGKNNGSIWNMVRILPEYQGKEIILEITSPYKNYRNVFNAVYIGSYSECMGFLLSKYAPNLVLISITFVIGVALFIYFIFLKISKAPTAERTLLVSLLAVFVSGWQFSECKITQILIGNMAGFSSANFLCLALLELPAIMYIDHLEGGRFHKLMVVTEYLFLGNAFVQIILQFTGVADFYEMMLASHIILVFAAVTSIVTMVEIYIKELRKEILIPLFSISFLSVSGVFEIIFTYVTGHVGGILIGLAVLVVVLSNGLESVRASLRAIEETKVAMAENAAKTAFLANMSHEIRTPMNAICALSELLANSDDLSSGNRDFAEMIHSSAENLLEIINDILDYSKITSGKYSVLSDKFEVKHLTCDVKEVIGVRAQNKGLDFVMRINPILPVELVGDEGRIRQILLNLLNNAVKFTDRGCVSLFVDCEYISQNSVKLIMTVTDTGIGIKKEDMDGLFEAFVQVEKAQKNGSEGTGLGLAISKQLALMMGGDITVKSEYGKGSEFVVTIIQKLENHMTFREMMCDYFQNRNEKCIILVKDDNYSMHFLEEKMKSFGADVRFVTEDELQRTLDSIKDSVVMFIAKAHPYLLTEEFCGRNPSTEMVCIAECLEQINAPENVDILRLPLTVADFSEFIYPSIPKENAVSFAAPSAKVLVVDDNIVNLRVMKEMLSKFGIKATMCSNGVQAIEAARVKKFDMIFMDHMMPGMDGIETAAKIRALEETGPDLKIMALSANAYKGIEKMFTESGFDGFVSKPVSLKSVGNAVLMCLPSEKIQNL